MSMPRILTAEHFRAKVIAMFLLSADKSKLTVLQKGIITSGSVNVYDVKFQFDGEWNGMERVAVFRVGKERVSVVLDDANTCKLPWECVRENYVGKEVLVGVYGMVGTTVVLPTVWGSLGNVKEGAELADAALPPTPSAAEQLLAQVLAARDEALAARDAAILAAGGTIPDSGNDTGDKDDSGGTDDTETEGTDTETDSEESGDVATDDEVNDALDDIFG